MFKDRFMHPPELRFSEHRLTQGPEDNDQVHLLSAGESRCTPFYGPGGVGKIPGKESHGNRLQSINAAGIQDHP